MAKGNSSYIHFYMSLGAQRGLVKKTIKLIPGVCSVLPTYYGDRDECGPDGYGYTIRTVNEHVDDDVRRALVNVPGIRVLSRDEGAPGYMVSGKWHTGSSFDEYKSHA